MAPYPEWLRILAWVSLTVSAICSIWILIHEISHPTEKMWIMYLVWPINALYAGPLALWGYFRTRKSGAHESDRPSTREVSVSVTHCGAGCTVGDLLGEFLAVRFLIATFLPRIGLDFLMAWLIGVVFQYFSIVPMRGLSPGKGILAAIRADTLSILAFEAGMLVWMALVYFVIFTNPHLSPREAVFWFMMQIAMCIGFLTSYPANVFLLKAGWKERMS